jgi:hypothetical protein
MGAQQSAARQASPLETMLRDVNGAEEGGEELARTPSVQADLAAGLARPQAARAQRLRARLRALDAEIAEQRAQLQRADVLRGPSTARLTCDPDCMVGGCGEEHAAGAGVLCRDCGLFLCHPCFGSTNVANECQVGGRYDSSICPPPAAAGAAPDPAAVGSPPGSLPCPLFPQGCAVGHVSLVEIQRAMLHGSNRGPDGEHEDIRSEGHSPHKLHLLARRRVAEAQVAAGPAAGGLYEHSSGLLRTLTELRPRQPSADTARARLAEKLDELQELLGTLEDRGPPAAVLPAGKRRSCAQCRAEFGSFEGVQCLFFRNSHFLCNLCFGGYVLRECSPGGAYARELRDEAGAVVSAAGCLPCAFFQHLPSPEPGAPPAILVAPPPGSVGQRAMDAGAMDAPAGLLAENALAAGDRPETRTEEEQQLAVALELSAADTGAHNDALPRTQSAADRQLAAAIEASMTPPPAAAAGVTNPLAGASLSRVPSSAKAMARDCHCGALAMATIERALLDPRNRSAAYWRERRRQAVVGVAPWSAKPRMQLSLGLATQAELYAGLSLAEALESEILGLGLTPHNVHETARLRLSLDAQALAAAERQSAETASAAGADEVEALRKECVEALDKGGALNCPQCGARALKDDACIHIDSCPCGSHWCFLCGRVSGTGAGQCPRGGGGCDAQSYYLEQHPGWGEFAIGDEEPAFGAQKELLRQRQAFFLRVVKEAAPDKLWERLRAKHPALLADVPTDGRSIPWAEIASAQYPTFGETEAPAAEGGVADESAAQRMEAHWAEIRRGQEALVRAQRVERIGKVVGPGLVAAAFLAFALVTASLPMPDPVHNVTLASPAGANASAPATGLLLNCSTVRGFELLSNCSLANLTAVLVAPAEEDECGWLCGVWEAFLDRMSGGECGWQCAVLFWHTCGGLVLSLVGFAACWITNADDMRDESNKYLLGLVAAAYWPIFLSPDYMVTGSWIVLYVCMPICAGALGGCLLLGFWGTLLQPCLGDMDDHEDELMAGAGLSMFIIRCALQVWTVHSRESNEPALPYVVSYECTWPCEALTGLQLAGIGAALLSTVHETYHNEDMAGGPGCRLAKLYKHFLPICLAAVLLTAWPLVLSTEMLATGSWYLYMLVPLASLLSWVHVMFNTAAVYEGTEGTVQLPLLLAIIVGALSVLCVGWLLLMFQQSAADDYTLWHTLLFWEAFGIVFCTVVTTAYVGLLVPDDDDELFEYLSKFVVWNTILAMFSVYYADEAFEHWYVALGCLVGITLSVGSFAVALWSTRDSTGPAFGVPAAIAVVLLVVNLVVFFWWTATHHSLNWW